MRLSRVFQRFNHSAFPSVRFPTARAPIWCGGAFFYKKSLNGKNGWYGFAPWVPPTPMRLTASAK